MAFSLDISMHKKGINIQRLKDEGLVHLYLKATEGRNYIDPCLNDFYNQAVNCGVPIGYYHFLTKNPDVEGQAEDFYNAVKGKKADLRYCLDMEVDLVGHSDIARRFINKFEQLMGKKDICNIYASGYYARDNFDNDIKNRYPLWVAQYGSSSYMETGFKTVCGWQYSESEYHQGQPCDANIFYPSILIPNSSSETRVNEPISTQTTPCNPLVVQAQGHSNNFAGCGLVCDGIIGKESRKATVNVLKRAMNLDYGLNLPLNGLWDENCGYYLSNHTVRLGETQYMVTALEILLMFNGYDPHGVESPGVFGQGLDTTLRLYQSDCGLVVDGIAGYNTFTSLIMN